jgi:hypothetical protein
MVNFLNFLEISLDIRLYLCYTVLYENGYITFGYIV